METEDVGRAGTRRPSVLHVLAPAPVGGLERVVETLAHGQRGRGLDVGVVAVVEPDGDEHPFVGRLRAASVPVEALEVPHRSYLRETRALASVFRRHEADLVHTHGYRADVLAAGVARRLGLATVSTVHGFTGGGWKNRFYEWLQRRSLARMDAVAAVSRRLGRELRDDGVAEGRLHVVRNAWSQGDGRPLDRGAARERLGLDPDGFVVGWVGRLSREKGADVLVRAAARLGDDPVTFSLLGEGPERERLEALAAELGVVGRLRLHGLVPEAAEVYPAFDAFALSSRTEGTPVSLFEAMEARVPIVATRVGGVPDVVRHDREALLVPPEDPPALAAALREVRHDSEAARERARRAGRRLEEEFAVEPWLDRYQEIYRKVVGNP